MYDYGKLRKALKDVKTLDEAKTRTMEWIEVEYFAEKEYQSSMNTWILSKPEINNRPVRDVYRDYVIYCERHNLDVQTKIMLSKHLRTFGFDTIIKNVNGKTTRIYKKARGY